MNTQHIKLAFVCSSALVASTTFATTWTVAVDLGTKADFTNIQDAIDAASNGDEILVHPGTYTDSGEYVIDMSGKAIWLHSIEGNIETYIDGQDARRVILCNSGETATTVIQGFTIQNGNATWHDWDGDGIVDSWETAGGGMANGMSHPALIDCIFTDNNGHQGGGGMFNYKSSPTITYCTFVTNSVDQNGSGAGMLNRNFSSPSLNNCSFTNNDAGNLGGGMYNYDGSSPSLSDCVLTGNNAYFGGGMYNRFFSEPTLMGCVLQENTATHGGGGMFNSSLSNTNLTECNFVGNTTSDGLSIAGGMGNSNSSPTLTDCSFTFNTTHLAGGGLYCSVGSQATITGCDFSDNQAEQNGGGAYFDFFSDSTIQNSTIDNNWAVNQNGGGIYIYDYCEITMINSSAQTNVANNGGGIWCSNQSELALTGCTIDGNTATSNADILARKTTEIQLAGSNTTGEVGLEDVGSELQFATGSVLTMNDSLHLSPQGGIRFDVHDLNASAPLTIAGTLERNGSFGITNDSGSLKNAAVGAVVPLVRSDSAAHTFSSIVLPAMPEGLGLQLTESSQPDQSIEIAIEVIQDDGAQFEEPLSAALDSTPVDLVTIDIEGDGKDEIAVLYGGSPGAVAVYEISGDGTSPTLIQNLVVNVGNNPVDFDAGDLNGDGMEDLVVANANDATVSVLTVTVERQSSHSFSNKTVPVTGTGHKPTCVAIIDWNSNFNPDGDIVVGVDKVDEAEEDGFQVILDVSSNESNGPLFSIPKYEYAGTEFADAPTGADGFRGGTVRGLERGFIGGTKYGNMYKGTIIGRGGLIQIGQLSGENISTIEVVDLDDNGGDGKPDILVGSDSAKKVYLLQGDDKRANGFGPIIPIDVSASVKDIFATDADGDGDVDLIVTAPGSASSFFVLRNGGASNLLPGGLGNRAWNKQDMPTGNTPDKVTGGDLDDRDVETDWTMGTGSDSGLLGGPIGSMEQTNIIIESGSECEGDINADGVVNVNDLMAIIAAWGPCTGCDADVNVDGVVNVNDLLILIAAWGPCAP